MWVKLKEPMTDLESTKNEIGRNIWKLAIKLNTAHERIIHLVKNLHKGVAGRPVTANGHYNPADDNGRMIYWVPGPKNLYKTRQESSKVGERSMRSIIRMMIQGKV